MIKLKSHTSFTRMEIIKFSSLTFQAEAAESFILGEFYHFVVTHSS